MAATRVHNLAKELGVESKEIIKKCAAEGVELKNHMAVVSVGLAQSIREWFSAGDDITTVEVAEPVDLAKVHKPARRKTTGKPESLNGDTEHGAESDAVESHDQQHEQDLQQVGESIAATATLEAPVAEPVAEPEPPIAEVEPPAPVTLVAPSEPVAAPEESAPTIVAAPIEHVPAPVTPIPMPAPAQPPGEMRPAARAGQKPEGPAGPQRPVFEPPKRTEPIRPLGPQLVPKPAELKGPRVVRIEAPEPMAPPRPRPRPASGGPGGGGGPNRPGIPMPPSPSIGGGAAGAAARRGRVPTRDEEAAAKRAARSKEEKAAADVDAQVREWREKDVLERQERLRSATGQGLAQRRAAERRRQSRPGGGPQLPGAPKRPEIAISTPIGMKDFCATVGVQFVMLFRKLQDLTGRMWTINEQLDNDTVVLLAAELGLEIKIEKAKTELEKLVAEVEARERKHLQPRPPVVTILGHVDHGKTSLLDKIRAANVAGGEAGGITQHIGAYRVDRGDWHVTFLDTPGHAAFTAMRARGANLTDVVVLVVAANDGVMPQTVEAINHAKAADVEIVVALNKIDIPGIDTNKVYGQLAERELVPTEWGGSTDVVKTSAATGVGVDDLLAHLSQLSELMDLKADPTLPATATVIEARMKEGHGAVAQVLVREGTLKVGQAFVCGPASGKIRSLRNDRGQPVKEAGPATPVEIAGLDELPSAGENLYVLSDLGRAKLIATEVQQARRNETLKAALSPRSTLEDLLRGTGNEDEIPELNVILKADVQGSVDALQHELSKLPKDRVKLVIKHSAVGAVNEADVDLAHVTGSIVVGFNVVPDDRARRRADEIGVEIRPYRIIYELIDDVSKALAGLLAPIEKEELKATVDVRKVFFVSKLGNVAGCLVSDGTIQRNHMVRLVRDGRVILEKAQIDSLKRFKDDAKEVKAGTECGIKIKGFDDVKPGDQIQAYQIVQIAQTL